MLGVCETRHREAITELTARQMQVLELVARRLTLKQVALELNISESAVNQHVKAIKLSLGANSLPELAELHREHTNQDTDSTCRKPAGRKSGVFDRNEPVHHFDPDDPGSVVRFHDGYAYRLEAPWSEASEPVVVPGLLRGANAKLIRFALIVGISVGVFALLLVALGVAQGLSNLISR